VSDYGGASRDRTDDLIVADDSVTGSANFANQSLAAIQDQKRRSLLEGKEQGIIPAEKFSLVRPAQTQAIGEW